MTRLHLATATTPGAIALLQLVGPGALQVLSQLTGKTDWADGRVRLCGFDNIDEGLAVVRHPGQAEPGDAWVQLMPHGGPRVMQRLIDRLIALGCVYEQTPDPCEVYPEAESPIEADVLHTIAKAASPAAIDLLAEQPGQWRGWLALPEGQRDTQRTAILERSAVLDRLIMPATVVVAGPANVGKSTLTNALMGRAVSIVADLPGTTRDWVGGMVELASATPAAGDVQAVAVRWLDTPGLRDSGDAIEQRAIALARRVVADADVLIAMRDAETDWPTEDALPRTPDLWVVNKCDGLRETPAADAGDAGHTASAPLRISAAKRYGLDTLQHRVLAQLGLDVLAGDLPWAFSPTLRASLAGDASDLSAYLQTRND